jgi:hypothetical protein
VKLHFHPAELVGIDLLAARTDDHRGLRSLHRWLRRQPLRPELLFARHRDEAARVLGAAALRHGFVAAELDIVGRADHQIFGVLIVALVLLEVEQPADAQGFDVGRPVRHLELRREFVDAHRR